jgi:DNA-binding beta-propeller fold protein YncE
VGSYKCECIRGYDAHDVGSSHKSCKAVGPHGSIIFVGSNTVKKISLAGPHESQLVRNFFWPGYIYDAALDYDKNEVYWIDNARIMSAQLSPLQYHEIAAVSHYFNTPYVILRPHYVWNEYTAPVWYYERIFRSLIYPNNNVRKLAYDWIRKQLYLVDTNEGTVQVLSTDGDQRCYVKSRLHQPKEIAVDPFNKELYVTVGGIHPGIARMKTDGSEFKMFLSDIGQPTGITLDLPGKRLYWLDAKYRLIESIGLDGKGRTVVKYLTNGTNFHTISVFEDHVYWTQKYSSTIFVANRFTGESVGTISTGLNTLPGFKVVHKALQISELCKYPEHHFYNTTISKKRWSKVGHYLNLKCKPGHQLEGNTTVIQCQSDGTWYPTPGKCIPQHEETAFCKYPERNSSYNENNPKKEQYEAGDQLVIKCKPGYQLKGSSVIDCRSDGIWHPRPGTCNPQHVDPRNSSIVDGTQERNIGIGIGTMLLIVVITITAIIVAIAAILVWKRRSLKSADPKVSYNVTKSPEDDTINLPGALETEDGESSTI